MQTHPEASARERRWPRFREDIAILLWASFLAACIATMLFFAYFDPQFLARDDDPPAWLADRTAAYSLFFFFSWGTSALAAFITAYLIDTRLDQSNPS
jgi:hypothetical protein